MFEGELKCNCKWNVEIKDDQVDSIKHHQVVIHFVAINRVNSMEKKWKQKMRIESKFIRDQDEKLISNVCGLRN